MPVYPALMLRPRQPLDWGPLERGARSLGTALGQRQRRNRLADLRREAMAGMGGGGATPTGTPDYFSGQGWSPEEGGMGFGGNAPSAPMLGGANRDREALYRYYAEDPKGAAELYGFVTSMDDHERAQAAMRTDELGRMLQWVQSAQNPLEASSRYQQALNLARSRGLDVGQAPPNYDPAWVGSRLALATKLSEQFKQAAEAAKAAATESRFVRGEAGKDRRARIKAGASGKLTKPQEADNIEKRTARQRIRDLRRDLQPGETLRDAILRRTQKATNTGRANPDYDPFLERSFRKATDRMVGDDPDYEQFLQELDEPAPQPIPVPRPRPEIAGNEPAAGPPMPTAAQRMRSTAQGYTPPADLGYTPELGHIPQAAISYLQAHPDLKEQFEAKYGPGTAQAVLSQAR